MKISILTQPDAQGVGFRIIIPGNGQIWFEFALRIWDTEKTLDEREDISRPGTTQCMRTKGTEIAVHVNPQDIAGRVGSMILV